MRSDRSLDSIFQRGDENSSHGRAVHVGEEGAG